MLKTIAHILLPALIIIAVSLVITSAQDLEKKATVRQPPTWQPDTLKLTYVPEKGFVVEARWKGKMMMHKPVYYLSARQDTIPCPKGFTVYMMKKDTIP
jgi:hypothetical protein